MLSIPAIIFEEREREGSSNAPSNPRLKLSFLMYYLVVLTISHDVGPRINANFQHKPNLSS